MKKQKISKDPPVYRLDPSIRLCPNYDTTTIALYPIADPQDMGFRVMDDFVEEHIQ